MCVCICGTEEARNHDATEAEGGQLPCMSSQCFCKFVLAADILPLRKDAMDTVGHLHHAVSLGFLPPSIPVTTPCALTTPRQGIDRTYFLKQYMHEHIKGTLPTNIHANRSHVLATTPEPMAFSSFTTTFTVICVRDQDQSVVTKAFYRGLLCSSRPVWNDRWTEVRNCKKYRSGCHNNECRLLWRVGLRAYHPAPWQRGLSSGS